MSDSNKPRTIITTHPEEMVGALELFECCDCSTITGLMPWKCPVCKTEEGELDRVEIDVLHGITRERIRRKLE